MKHKATKQILSILLAMIMIVGMLPTTALAEDKINQVSLTLDVPVIGQTLDFTPTAYAGIYEITSVRWLKDWGEHGNMLCDIYHTVEPGEPYTVRIYINPKEGYSFADLDDVTVTVNGSTDGVTFTHDDLYTGIICSVAFEKLGYAVSFNANGGTGTMDEVTDVYPDYTLPACDFTAPEGKVFNGWTVGSPSGKWYAEGSKLDVNSDVTLYAKWADPTGSHKITFVNRTTDPYSTVEIIVSEGMYTLPGIEGIFQIPWGSTFDDWGINTGSGYTYYDAGAEISVTEDLEIIATWAYIEYEYISKAVFDVKLNSGAEYKHGMLAGSLSVSLGDVTGSFKEGAAQPISLASGGYGHGYWIVSGDMLLGTDALSTRKGYRLYVKFDIPDDRNVRFNSDDFSLFGDLGNIAARNIVSLDGALVAIFVLPAVPGTPLTADVVTFTLGGYAIDQTIPAVTVDSSTAHVSLQGSGYGIDNAYMIYEDYVDFDTKVTDPHAKFEKHQDYCLQIDYALDEGYSFPDSFWDGSYLKKDKFKLAGFEDAVVTAVTKTSVSFRLPQLGTTAVESLEITLNGYEAGKTAWDVSLTAPECMNLPELDNPTYPPYGRLYCYYDPVYGFGDSADGDCSPIDSGTVLKVGDQYPFAIKFYPVDGYNYSELEKENIRLVTPYGTCTATRFRPGFSENSYWLTFDLPAILTYTVSFTANGGTGTMADVTGISGEYTLPENGFTAPDGKQFKAWSVGGSEKAVGDKITVTADTTVTAVWETIPAGHTCDIKSVAKVNPSCTEGGKEAYYKCEGCGKFYEDALGTKEITDLASWGNLAKLGHTESDWKSDKDNHWKECTVVSCGVIIDSSKAAHTPDRAEATETDSVKCSVCGYVITPALGHTHDVDTTKFESDETNHWNTCSGCSEKQNVSAHEFEWKIDKDATATEKGSKHEECKVCSYRKAAVEIPATGTPTDPTPENPDSPQTGDNSMMGLWIAVLFVSGFGVVTTAVYGKKRKAVK